VAVACVMEQWAFQLAFPVQRRLYSDQYFHTRGKSLHFELCLNTDMPLWEQPSESSFGSLWGVSWGRKNNEHLGVLRSLWGTCWVWGNRSSFTSNKYTTSNGSFPIDGINTWFPLMGKKLLRILAVPISPARSLLFPSTFYLVQSRYNSLSSRRYVQCAIKKPYLIRWINSACGKLKPGL